jgi:hypothetical protein
LEDVNLADEVRQYRVVVNYNVNNYSMYFGSFAVFGTKEMREATEAAGGTRLITLRRAGEALQTSSPVTGEARQTQKRLPVIAMRNTAV